MINIYPKFSTYVYIIYESGSRQNEREYGMCNVCTHVLQCLVY